MCHNLECIIEVFLCIVLLSYNRRLKLVLMCVLENLQLLAHLGGSSAIHVVLFVVCRPSIPEIIKILHLYLVQMFIMFLVLVAPPTSIIKLWLGNHIFTFFYFFSETSSRWRFILCPKIDET